MTIDNPMGLYHLHPGFPTHSYMPPSEEPRPHFEQPVKQKRIPFEHSVLYTGPGKRRIPRRLRRRDYSRVMDSSEQQISPEERALHERTKKHLMEMLEERIKVGYLVAAIDEEIERLIRTGEAILSLS